MKNLIVAILFLLLPALSIGQAGYEIGFPFVRNYTTSDYHAHAQNFAVAGDQQGIMYFGNFAGVLQYDGETWRLIPTGNTTKVSALATDSTGKVYVGARGEIGFLEHDKTGVLKFTSLLKNFKAHYNPFYDILRVFIVGNKVHFIAGNLIFTLENGDISVWTTPNEILNAFLVRGVIYLQLKKTGLVSWHGGKMEAHNQGSVFSGARVISAMLPFQETKTLIATSSQGLYLMEGSSIHPFTAKANELLTKNPVTSGVALSDGSIALGTSRLGIIIIDNEGNIRQIIDKAASLQNSFVQTLYINNDNTLWAALNNGIAMVEIPSPFTYFDEKSGLMGGVNQIIRFRNTCYVATYQGLYYYDETTLGFTPVKEIISACWRIASFNNELYAATSQGVFIIKNNKAVLIRDGFILSMTTSPKDPSGIYLGETRGFYRMTKKGDSWNVQKFDGIDEEINDLKTDNSGNIWGLCLSKGLFRYRPGDATLSFFSKKDGLPGVQGITINPLDKTISLGTSKGRYVFNETTQSFDSARLISDTKLIADEWFSLIVPDKNGNLWVNSGEETDIKVLIRNGDQYQPLLKPFLPIADYVIWCVFPEETGITWLGGPEGLIRYDAAVRNKNVRPYSSLLRRIIVNNDSVIFDGNITSAKSNIILKYSENSVTFEFSTPFHSVKGDMEYQFYLEGFEDTWNDWSAQTVKEYTNLPGGKYVFHVRARNIFEELAPEAEVKFLVLSPWYNSIWAIVLYIIIFGGIVYAIVLFRNQKLLKEKRILEERIAVRTAEVVQQKEEIENQSQELANKNDELEKINSAIKSINAEINYENLLQSLLEKMKIIRAAEKSLALVFDKNVDAYRFKACIGYAVSDLGKFTINLAQAENRYLKNTEEVFEDIFIKSEFSSFGEIEELQNYVKPKSVMVLVIRIENKIDAFLIFENHSRANAFESSDISLIRNSKEHIISAIIRTRLLDDLQQTLHNLKDTQDQLIQSEKLASLGQLTAGIAHEIQNPLNFVNNFASLSVDLADELNETLEDIRESFPTDKYEDVSEVIGMIKGNVVKINEHGKRVESIVKGMLQHSRGRTSEFEEVDLNNIVTEYVNLAYHGLRAKDKSFNTAIRINLDPAIGKVSIIPQDLSRVVLNIVNNACYAVDEKSKTNLPGFKPEVLVTTRKVQNKVEIRIRDNGTGIPQQVIEKIFNPFFTTKPTGKGTGLGLSMSFDIVNKIHKGKLEVESKEGEYTEFIITIPEKQS